MTAALDVLGCPALFVTRRTYFLVSSLSTRRLRIAVAKIGHSWEGSLTRVVLTAFEKILRRLFESGEGMNIKPPSDTSCYRDAIPTRGFTAAVSVFRGTPPGKPIQFSG